jgi:hypothetical protein
MFISLRVFLMQCLISPITVAEWSKVWPIFACSNAGAMGSNTTQGMAVCIYSVCAVLCVGRGLATG